ncbi:hypothetical protein, partial [Glutamicibacter arilaitensis]|uniref:hypothetical protein n=1 Tax=Glutamicibacter arilaitensis TaxID=256701 RepID=UPI003F91232A
GSDPNGPDRAHPSRFRPRQQDRHGALQKPRHQANEATSFGKTKTLKNRRSEQLLGSAVSTSQKRSLLTLCFFVL